MIENQNMIPVKGESKLFRDSRNNAVINISDTDYELFLKRKKALNSTNERIESLEQKMDLILSLLSKLETKI
jgi:hypothetical protein